jgi:hypothetical protein
MGERDIRMIIYSHALSIASDLLPTYIGRDGSEIRYNCPGEVKSRLLVNVRSFSSIAVRAGAFGYQNSSYEMVQGGDVRKSVLVYSLEGVALRYECVSETMRRKERMATRVQGSFA